MFKIDNYNLGIDPVTAGAVVTGGLGIVKGIKGLFGGGAKQKQCFDLCTGQAITGVTATNGPNCRALSGISSALTQSSFANAQDQSRESAHIAKTGLCCAGGRTFYGTSVRLCGAGIPPGRGIPIPVPIPIPPPGRGIPTPMPIPPDDILIPRDTMDAGIFGNIPSEYLLYGGLLFLALTLLKK
ncbi:MAG: hypothetical protein ACREI9_15295 [Nitrospiraceae bacterium]